MKWKVVAVGPAGTAYKDTNAFKLLYPDLAGRLTKVVDQNGNVAVPETD
jgi:hypothetical protein